ncbi:hypothetical protein [Pseudoduganella ginsengisoli]|uniref:Uncharacterized protein n=1 Tax=Pseudoduganella ginsengisoli TaxID=1462440 RepID=A0A6L6Q4M1_9BURK|nr:hypothetical protein [Pseudoduganella ginsengisoli]MTW04062.1 hypothetical protein [Pseudoduganella ginsengisoli]
MVEVGETRHFGGENMPMQNFCAWIEIAYESKGLVRNKAIAHNLINRMWGELHTCPGISAACFLSVKIKAIRIKDLISIPGLCSHFFPQNLCRSAQQSAA